MIKKNVNHWASQSLLLLVWLLGSPSGQCFCNPDGHGGKLAAATATPGQAVSQPESGLFGALPQTTSPMASSPPPPPSTKDRDEKADPVDCGYRYYNPSTGRWLNRDPLGEEAGSAERDQSPEGEVPEQRNEPYLCVFIGNNAINSVDALGLWKVERNGAAKAPVKAEVGDTIADLADLVGLSAWQYEKWLTVPSGTTMPASATQKMTGCEHFEVPNTVVAYWAGNLGWAGRVYTRWNSSVKYLESLGFKVDDYHHKKGDPWRLMYIFQQESVGKELHGLYFWGHGGRLGPKGTPAYPARVLFSASGDPVLQFNSPGLAYGMALGLVFACDSNSGERDLMSGSMHQIWNGYTGTLVPWPFRRYHPKHFIEQGEQATH